MATKKELDDMLNDLANNSKPQKQKNKNTQPDDTPLDELLDALDSVEKSAEEEQKKKVRTLDPKEKTQVFGNKPASAFDKKFGKKLKPIPDTPVERPVYPSDDEPSPVKKKKMKIVISDNLPDYEAIRQQELEKDRAAKAAEEAHKAEAAAAEESRLAAEKIAEKRRKEEEAAAEKAKKAALERQRLAEERAQEEAIIARKRKEAEEKAKQEAEAAAERMRLAEERAAEEERIASEKKRKAEEKAEEEAKAAEIKRIAEVKAAKKKALAEKMAKLAEEENAPEAEENVSTVSEDDALKKLSESDDTAPAEELPPVVSLEDEADSDIDAAAEVDEAIEALGAAAEEPEDIDLIEDPEFAAYLAKKKAKAEKKAANKTEKKGLLAKLKSIFSADVFDEDEQEEFAEKPAEKSVEEDEDVIDSEDENMFDNDTSEADELVSEAIAAINEEPVISADEAVQAEEAEEEPIAEESAETAEEVSTETQEDSSADDFSIEEITEEESADTEAVDYSEEDSEDENGLVSSLEDILDEDPEELVRTQSEQAEFGNHPAVRDVMAKRRKYAVIGIICGILALIGICAILAKGIGAVKNIGNANDKKDKFTDIIYPATIMDIDAFNTPSELNSEQIITATIWSIIMDKNKIGNYESQLGDTVSIPDVDVEKYAVQLFGENIPAFEHCTVGPVEARFYYSNGAYNVKLKPITFTYAPDVRSVVKSGDIYTLTVDYIDELPEWMPKSVAKTVEYQLTEQNDGTFTIDSMRIISVKSSNL